MKEKIELLYQIQTRLELLVEDAYRYYKKKWFWSKSKSTKTYEDGLMTAIKIIEDFKS